jgi:hypothetical protein
MSDVLLLESGYSLLLESDIAPAVVLPTFKAAVYAYVAADPVVSASMAQLEILRASEESQYPALTFRIQTRTQPVILDGPAQHDEVECEIRIRGCQKTAGSNGASILVDDIALRVRALFNGKPSWDMAGLPIMASWVDDDTDDYDTADDASDEGSYIQTLNIFVRHRLAV